MWRSNTWRILSSGILVMIVFFGSVGSTMYQAHGAGEHIFQLTDNQYGDSYPQIHNGQVTWQGSDGSDNEIFLYNGSSVIQLTSNSYHDLFPQIHSGQVTWKGDEGSYCEVFLYYGSSVIQLTDNKRVVENPQIHNGQVTWNGFEGSDYEIFLARTERTVIQYESETPTIRSDASNTVDVLVVTPEDLVILAPGESTLLPEAAPQQSFTLNLTAGWNMVSIPFLPPDPSADSVLSKASFYQLVSWSGTGYVVATEFEIGKGYWLLVLEDTNITITG